MSELLIVPLKKPAEVDVIKPLKNLIQSAYNTTSATDNPIDFNVCVNEFSKLRNVAIWKFFEKYESSLEIVYGYYDQICNLEKKIPASELQIPFKWKDAFDKGSIFGGRISLTLPSLSYEKVCVLFNIAALQSHVANTLSVENNDDSLKNATKLYQHSAGIFSYLAGATPAAIPQEPTPDLNPDTLQALSNLMVAQAQEIFTMKAIKDNMKDAVIAKLACQCEELYADVLRGLQKDSLRSLWDKEWIPTIAGKQAGFHAITQLYQSLVCRANKSIGEEISRLQHAVELFQTAQSRSGKVHLFGDYAGKAQRNLAEAKKDNDFIYNEMIPEFKTLNPPGKALLAKAISIAPKLSTDNKDLFNNLIPVALHQAMNACDARKNEMVNSEILKLREATQTLNGVLASLNLPAAIEITNSGAMPQSILDKSKAVHELGGLDSINNLLKDLPEALTRNREILDEAERMLNEERDSDKQLRSQFKERWSRTPSEKLTEIFRSNIAKYRDVINTALQADHRVREKFDKYLRGIEMLSKSASDLEGACPSGGGVNISNCSSVQKLKTLMDSVETIKAERDVMESELKSATVNMKEQFLQALSQDGAINEPALSVPAIGQTIAPLLQQVQDSMRRQETLIADIQSTHKLFTSETGGTGGSRDAFLSELASAYDNFVDLQKNLSDGTAFYNGLTQLLVQFQNKVSDYCFARKTEKEELLKDLTQETSRQQPAVSPTLPSHFEPTPTRPAPTVPSTDSSSAPPGGQVPYPTQMQGMPIPYGATTNAPYPTYVQPPMPQGFNPYATLPYPQNAQQVHHLLICAPYNYAHFPQGPQQYGTYPGNYGQQPPPGFPQQPQPGYPQQQPQQHPPPQGW